MTRSRGTVVLAFCLASASVLLTGERRGWWRFAPPIDWELPLGIMAVGIIVWAKSFKNRGGT